MSQRLSQRRQLCERIAAYLDSSGQPCEIVEDEEDGNLVLLQCPLAINLDVEDTSPEVTNFILNIIPLEDSFGDLYARLVIFPFVDREGSQPSDALHQELARLNHDIPQLKFALDEEGDVELLVDIPAALLDEQNLQATLRTMVDYLNYYYEPLSSLVTPQTDSLAE